MIIKKYLLPILCFFVATSSLNASQDCAFPSFGEEVGFYQGTSLGTSILRIEEREDFSIEKTGICFDVFQGYKFEDIPIKLEQKISFNCHCLSKRHRKDKSTGNVDHTFNSFGVTENFIFDLSELRSGGPYFGLGVGYKELKGTKKELVRGRFKKRNIKTTGTQAIIGANFVLYPVFSFQVEYKCFTAKNYAFTEHCFCINFRSFT